MKKRKDLTKKGGKAALILRFLKGCKHLFLLGIIFDVSKTLAEMLGPQIIRAAIDNAIGGNPADYPDFIMNLINKVGGFEYLGKNLWIMAIALVAAALVKVTMEYCSRVSNARASETLVKNMRDTLFSHIQRLPFSWHMKNRTGDIIQRCTSDIDTVKGFVSGQLVSILCIVFYLVLACVFMFSMNVRLTLIALIPMPIILFNSILFHKGIKKGFAKCDENEGVLSAMAQENLTGVRVVRAFGREAYERERFYSHNEYYTGLWVSLGKIMSRFWSSADILSGLQVLLVVIFGAVFCVGGSMLSGEYLAFISYNSMLIWPIRMLGRMISEMSKAGVSIDRIRYIMDSEQERDDEQAVEADMGGDITFENVNFAYEGCPQMLHDISFTVKSGTTLGILGSTGSGKSTLMMLLDKMYDLDKDGGKITIGGVDIRKIKTEHLRKNISIVLQEPYLFSRTISENIGITSRDITLTDIRKAAKAACLDDAVTSFAKGYETFVGERGVTLSGGQKQRAAIARVLVRNTPIMIFDDSLSAVDTETDAKIRAALEERFGSATIILISHRITTLSKADKILVLDKGRIIEQGTHEELSKAGGVYENICEIQLASQEEVQ